MKTQMPLVNVEDLGATFQDGEAAAGRVVCSGGCSENMRGRGEGGRRGVARM